MEEGKLAKKSIDFAIEIVAFYEWLTKEAKEYVMSKQLLRSGTSIGANIHEANYAASRADFIAKLQIALKEASETEYWITVLERCGYVPVEFSNTIEKLLEIKRMLISSIKTAKQKIK